MEVVPVAVSRVVQIPANRVLAIERLDRPPVGGANGSAVGDDTSLRELRPPPGCSRCRGRERKGGDENGGGYERPATPADMCGGCMHATTVRWSPNRSVTRP